MLGSTITEDLRIRYLSQFVTFGPSTPENPWASIEIQVLASVEAIATLVAYRYARARGATAIPVLAADAERYIKLITNRYIRQQQRVPYTRQPYGDSSTGDGHSGGSWGFWGW